MPPNSYIVLQCYGNKSILQECAFALLTLCRQHRREDLKNIQIWLYTDQPEFFQGFKENWLPLHFRTIDAGLIREWRGKIDFVHRVKVKLLQDFTQQREGNILYLDTDICFTEPVNGIFQSIAEGRLFMHIMEGKVHGSGQIMLQKLSAFLNKNQPLKINGKSEEIAGDVVMWNAGVLGFSTQYRHLLDDVLQFTDAVYPLFPKHIVEQFAFSVSFQNTKPVKAAYTHIIHYWNLKELRAILDSFFSYFSKCTWDELMHYSHLIQLAEPMQQKINFLHNRTAWQKIRKKKWNPELPDWRLLLQQL